MLRLDHHRLGVGMYGRMYGKGGAMQKTTVYLPDDLKAALERAAEAQGCSEADLIRKALRDLLARYEGPPPRLPLFSSSNPILARQVGDNRHEALAGFGENEARVQ
jgi:hypothetical protein